jgi:hypothetical protein
MDRIAEIVKHLRLVDRPQVKRSDLVRASDINHIKKAYGSFCAFCKAHNLKTTFSERRSIEENRNRVLKLIKKLGAQLGRAPTNREIRKVGGSPKYGVAFNELLKIAGYTPPRTTNITVDGLVKQLQVYHAQHGTLPFACDLKTEIGVASNCAVIAKHGGYDAFLARHNLSNLKRLGKVTIRPTFGLDGRLYQSYTEAILADWLLGNGFDYLPQLPLGTYRHPTTQLTLDFHVRIGLANLAVEVDGMGKLRRNHANMNEKERRCRAKGWWWLVMTREQVRHLKKSGAEYWDGLVSSAKPSLTMHKD